MVQMRHTRKVQNGSIGARLANPDRTYWVGGWVGAVVLWPVCMRDETGGRLHVTHCHRYWLGPAATPLGATKPAAPAPATSNQQHQSTSTNYHHHHPPTRPHHNAPHYPPIRSAGSVCRALYPHPHYQHHHHHHHPSPPQYITLSTYPQRWFGVTRDAHLGVV